VVITAPAGVRPRAARRSAARCSIAVMHQRTSLAVVLVLTLAAPAIGDEAPLRGNEVIHIEGSPPPPKVKARAKKRYLPRGEIDNVFLRPAPAYSDKAILSDAWSLAWMLLDIDETGAVTRVKFLKYPGSDLEGIAVKTAMKLQFDPAIADDGKPTRSYIVWPIEWPSYGWLLMRTGLASGIPDVSHIPCRGSGPLHLGSLHPVYRDCSAPTWSNANSEPWLTAPPKPEKK
jgi:hypothetical protein